jgi:hypothetical protein
VGPGDQELGGADGADAGLGEQGGHPGADQAANVVEAGFQGGLLVAHLAGELAQGGTQVLVAEELAGAGRQGQGDADLSGGGAAAELGRAGPRVR